MVETGGGKNFLVGSHEHCSTNTRATVDESPLIAPVNRPPSARRARAGRGCTGAADWSNPSRNPLGLTQVGPKVSGARDTREGAGRRPRAAPAQHSPGAGVPESSSRNCAGAVCPALKGGVSLRRAPGWGKTRAGIGRGAVRRDVLRVGPDGACALRGRRGGWEAGGRGPCGFFPTLRCADSAQTPGTMKIWTSEHVFE